MCGYGAAVYLKPVLEEEELKTECLLAETKQLQTVKNDMFRAICGYRRSQHVNMKKVRIKGEHKCHDQMATKSPRRPDGDLNGSWEPNGDQNKPFWTPLGHHGHLGRHLVAIRSSRQFGHGTCVHLRYHAL